MKVLVSKARYAIRLACYVATFCIFTSSFVHAQHVPAQSHTAVVEPTTTKSWAQLLHDLYCLLRSACSFHISRTYNTWRFGSTFNFDRIAGDTIITPDYCSHGICMMRNAHGDITAINDGKQTPLVLGSIPSSAHDIERLKTTFHLQPQDPLTIFTLNRPFERNWAGETHLIKTRPDLYMHEYPTTDYTVPSPTHTIQAVYALDKRDRTCGTTPASRLAYVHCKAGRGRSAFIVAAYLIHIAHQAHIDASIEQIIAYIKRKRPQISLYLPHIKALKQFKSDLVCAGDIDALYANIQPTPQHVTPAIQPVT